jgi:predicted ATPase/DNA-binding SARP family transcriptional activator
VIEISVLGPLHLVVGGATTGVPGRRERVVLSVLTVNAGEAVSVGKLADHLWGEAPPRTWQKALQSAVSNIRNVVETAGGTDPGWLETTEAGYRLALPAERIDLYEFHRHAARGREHLRAGDASGARRSFAAALALWRAEEPADMGDGVTAAGEAARLQEARLAVLADRFDADLAVGGNDDVVAELQALCERWPDRERFHEQLMLALYRDGRQAEALAVAAELRSGLVERHGLDPSTGIRELEERILAQDPGLLASHEPSPATVRTPEATGRGEGTPSVPTRGPLVGRDQDLNAITAALQHARLVTLVGPGGVGKTSLAAVVAHHAAEKGFDVVWCSLGDVLQPDNLVPALSTTLAVPQRKDVTMREGILQRLRVGRVLLVVDNCEHLLDGVADLVAELVDACPDLRVVATSRERLGLDVEQVWPLEGLSLPDPDGADARESPAVQLFLDRAARSDAHFRADESVLAAIIAICRALDGIPLALELAAARVRAIPPSEIATRLDARFKLLTGRRGATERHHSLRAAIEWSYDLLGDRQRNLLRRLGTFAGPFTMTAAAAVASLGELDEDEIPLLLADLVDKSMVAVNPSSSPTRYRLLETMRVFAREERATAGEATAADDAFLAHVVKEVQALDDRLTGPDELEAVEAAGHTFDNVRHAVALARDRGDHQLLSRILSGLTTYLRFRVSWEASTWFQEAAALANPALAGQDLANKIVGMAAWGLWLGGELDAAAELVTQARRTADPHDPNVVYILAAGAVVEMYRNDATSIATSAEALTLAEATGRHWLAAYLLGAAALAHAYQGEISDATALLARQAALVSRLENDTARAWWLYCSAEVSGDRDPERTLDLARRALALARRTKASIIENTARITVVSVASRHGTATEATDEFAEVIERCWGQGAWTHLHVTVHNLIEVLAELGADEHAVTLLHADPEGATEAYGDQRQRLDVIAEALAGRMPEDRYAQAVTAGQQLTRDGVARTALDALASLQSSKRDAD